MEQLIELVQLISKRKLSQIEVFDKSLISRKDTLFAKLYNGIADGDILTDFEAMQILYGKKNDTTNYRKLKSRFKERLLNTLYFIDLNHTTEEDGSKKAYFNCTNRLYLSNILLRYAENRTISIQLILDSYPTAKKYNFYDILKEYSYKLLVHYGMNGNEKKYHDEYEAYLKYTKEYELEQQAQLIYTKVMFTVHYSKLSIVQKETELKKLIKEATVISEKAKSLVVYFIHIRTLLFYYEITGNNKKIKETCDVYLTHYKKYLTTILSNNYLNTIYIYKLKSLADMRDSVAAESLITQILSISKGANYLAVREFEIKLLLNRNENFNIIKEKIHEIKASAHFKQSNNTLKERWFVYNAYASFLESVQLKGVYKFSLSKFNNEIPTISQDKSGFNLSARILSIIFYIARRDFENAMQQIEALRMYQIRYLKDSSHARSNLFIKLLFHLEKRNFSYREQLLHKEYLILKEHYEQQIMHESEVIFYDKLWEIIIDILKNK